MSDEERRAFAVPFAEGEYDGIDLSLLDRDDEDDRRTLILAEHPEFREGARHRATRGPRRRGDHQSRDGNIAIIMQGPLERPRSRLEQLTAVMLERVS